MAAYLLTGPSGSGKSTVGRDLASRGYAFIETDHEPGLSGFYDTHTGEKIEDYTFPLTDQQLRDYAWNWDKDVMDALFKKYQDETVFFCGGAYNETDFYDRFALRFAMCTDNETLKTRLQSREPERWYDGSPELMKQTEWNTKFIEYSRSLGAILIDSSRPIEIVSSDILSRIS